MSWVFVGLLACAVVVLAAAEWPRLAARVHIRARDRRRDRRKRHLRLVNDSDDFAASVERDLAQLPTIDDRD